MNVIKPRQWGMIMALVWPMISHADSPEMDVYSGTIGQKGIILELDQDQTSDGDVEGRFFYKKDHRDIPLAGHMSTTGQLILRESTEDAPPDTATPQSVLTLSRRHEGGWEGFWKDAKGNTLPVELTHAEIPDNQTDRDDEFWRKLRKTAPYEYLRIAKLTLKKSDTQKFMGSTLQWWEEPESSIHFFQITHGYPDVTQTRINNLLRERLWQEVIEYHTCMFQSAHSNSGEYAQTVTPQLMTPELFSVSVFTSYDCGGAHPDFGDNPINLNVRTMKNLVLEDLFWVGQNRPFHYEDTNDNAAFETYTAYREKELAPWLVSYFKARYPDKMKPGSDQPTDTCDYTDTNIWTFASWVLTPKGILLDPSFPRAARACEGTDWTLLPYADVRQHLGGVRVPLPADSEK
jgi:hypothetical protein